MCIRDRKREYPVYGGVKTDAKVRISKAVALHRTRQTLLGPEHMTIQRSTSTLSSDLELTCRRLSVRPGCWTWSTCRQSDGARQLRPRPMEVWAWGEASASYTREATCNTQFFHYDITEACIRWPTYWRIMPRRGTCGIDLRGRLTLTSYKTLRSQRANDV